MISKALFNLVPGSLWTLIGEEKYENVIWSESNIIPMPTKEAVLAESARIINEYNALEYQRLRLKEYPSYADQFDLLYHGGHDAWKASIDLIKSKYPKPE